MNKLALRNPRPASLMTRELKKRKSLTLKENIQTYPQLWLMSGIIPVILTTIALIAGYNPLGLAVSLIVLVTSCLAAIAGGVWAIDMVDHPAKRSDKRRFHALAARSRLGRAHAQDELGRLRELDHAYPRYSVLVERDSTDITLSILKHEYVGGLLGWRASTTHKGYDMYDGYDSSQIDSYRISEPNLEKVQEALEKMQEKTEALENKAYQEALKKYQLDCLVLAVQPPPASTAARAKIAVSEFEEELSR